MYKLDLWLQEANTNRPCCRRKYSEVVYAEHSIQFTIAFKVEAFMLRLHIEMEDALAP